jgi:capsular exopolysaccharide synthesis family protein
MLLQYWQVVLRWRWVIVGIMVSTLALGLVLTLLSTPQYTATARIEISREEKNITNVEGVEAQNAGQNLEFYQTQYNLLQARSLAERVVRKLRLTQDEGFFEAHGVDLEAGLFGADVALERSRAGRTKREEKAIELLLDNVEISPLRGSALVDIQYTSGSPQLSATIANEWTQQYIALNIDRRFASTADARSFLEGRLADLRSRVETSERDLVNYAANKGIVPIGSSQGGNSSSGETTLIAANLQALNEELNSATAERVDAEARLRSGASKTTSQDPLLINSATVELRQRRAELQAEYARLLVQFEPEYPAAVALEQQLDALDQSIMQEEMRLMSREASRSNSVLAANYQAAMDRERRLRNKVEELKARLDRQQRDTIQYNIYQREADTNRQLYDGLLQRYKEIGVAGVGANNIAIIDTAVVPDRPSKPSLPLNLVLSVLAGLVVSVAAILALDQIDESLRDPSQVNHALQLPLLGTVPDAEEVDDIVGLLQDAKTELSEAYISIRSHLAFSTDRGVPRTLMITSSRSAEGKSTTSFALAMVLARTGKKVLLIDADMRSPSIHQFIGISNDRGLSNFLSGENDWARLVKPGSEGNPTVMLAGPTPPSAAELLSSDRMSSLIEQLLEHYDNLVIDSPPVLGLADAPLLSRSVEGCVFVCEAEGVSVRGIKTAIGRLQAVHAHIFGVVLTKFRLQSAGYGYGYDYGYGYGRKDAD